MGQKFGQHFLHDRSILIETKAIIQTLIDQYTPQLLIEIGPGQGALTRHLKKLRGEHSLTVIETDERLRNTLTRGEFAELDVLRGDVLEVPFDFGESWLVVGNLPYYITSPIFMKCFGKGVPEGAQNTPEMACFGGVFLIQREVALKVDAHTKKKSYLGRCMQYGYDVHYEFTVGPECFTPPPKVDSAVISVRRREVLKGDTGDTGEARPFSYERLTSFLDIVSQYTRKTLGKIEKMRSEDFVALGVTVPEHLKSMRVEAMSREQMGEVLTVEEE